MRRILKVLTMSLLLAILVTALFAGAVFAANGNGQSGDFDQCICGGSCDCDCDGTGDCTSDCPDDCNGPKYRYQPKP